MHEAVYIEEDEQTIVELAYSRNIFALDLTQARRRRDGLRGNAQDLRYGIDDKAKDCALDFNDDDARLFVVGKISESEPLAQGDDGNDLPAEIDDSIHKWRRIGNASEVLHTDNFLHTKNVETKFLFADAKTDDLDGLKPGLGGIRGGGMVRQRVNGPIADFEVGLLEWWMHANSIGKTGRGVEGLGGNYA